MYLGISVEGRVVSAYTLEALLSLDTAIVTIIKIERGKAYIHIPAHAQETLPQWEEVDKLY
jgi:hypothetical protein